MTTKDEARTAVEHGVDMEGDSATDPTRNVIALSAAANVRQDDLRAETNRRVDSELRHVRETAALRAEHAKEIRELESRRLDAIRQVDVTAVKTEADRALAAIQTLAATTATNAENIRNAMTNTAAAIATQTANTVSQITERIAALEKSSYEGAGKQAVADPMMEKMVNRLETLITTGAVGSGQSQGQKNIVAYIATGISILVALLFLADRFGK